MAVLLDKYVDDDVRLGIWQIEESYEQLMEIVKPDQGDLKTVTSFKSPSRKLEWLSVRALIYYLTSSRKKIAYTETRKPYLVENTYNISISHSKNITSILLSKKKDVGIDLEYMSHKISHIAERFINRDEYITRDKMLEKLHLYIHWCAKEALYKICNKKDISFKKNLTIAPFQMNEQGRIMGTVNNRYGIEHFDMNYFIFDNYSVVWCTK